MNAATPILDMAETITQRLLAGGQETALARLAYHCTRASGPTMPMAALGALLSTMLTERGLDVLATTHDEPSARRMLTTLLEVTT